MGKKLEDRDRRVFLKRLAVPVMGVAAVGIAIPASAMTQEELDLLRDWQKLSESDRQLAKSVVSGLGQIERKRTALEFFVSDFNRPAD